MLQTMVIGHLGSDAQFQSSNGREFTTFRVAHTDRWKSEDGQEHVNTTWVDCIMSGKPAVIDYLKKGQMVYAIGTTSLRVYSSKQDRCMKAGMQINVSRVELLGGKSDPIPSTLYNANTGEQVDIEKYYNAKSLQRPETADEWVPLVDRSQGRYVADRNGWVQVFNDNSNEQQAG